MGATGLFVDLATSPGLQHTATGLQVDMQGNNTSLNANGLQITHNTSRTGWAFGSNDTLAPNTAIARGAQVQIGSGLSLAVVNTGTIAQYFLVQSNWEGLYQTTFPSLGDPSNILDSIQVNLQYNVGAGWLNLDWSSINSNNQSQTFHLRADHPLSVAAGATVTYQTRLLAIGSVLTATAIQGRVNTTFRRYIQAFW